MKVIFRKIFSEVTGEDLKGESPWRALAKKYVVLGLQVDPLSGIHILIQSDHYGIGIFPSLIGFEVLSDRIPASWIVQNEDGIIYMLPKRWSSATFLDEAEDEVPEAVEIFDQEAAIMYAEEGFVIQNTH